MNKYTSNGFYENFKKDGIWEYYENDLLVTIGHWRNGRRHGTWEHYDDDGEFLIYKGATFYNDRFIKYFHISHYLHYEEKYG